jgi:hypothetical protein
MKSEEERRSLEQKMKVFYEDKNESEKSMLKLAKILPMFDKKSTYSVLG